MFNCRTIKQCTVQRERQALAFNIILILIIVTNNVCLTSSSSSWRWVNGEKEKEPEGNLNEDSDFEDAELEDFEAPVDGFYSWSNNSGSDFAVSLPALYRILIEDLDFLEFLEEKYVPLFKSPRIKNPHRASIEHYIKGYNSEILGGLEKWSNLVGHHLTSLAVLQHPFLIYQMLRRHVNEYQVIHSLLRQQLELVPEMDGSFEPSRDDVAQSSYFIVLTQYIYDFNITQFGQGQFGNVDTGVALRPFQCLSLAKTAENYGMYSSAVKWLSFALSEASTYTEDKVRIIKDKLAAAIQQHDENWDKQYHRKSFSFFTTKIFSISRYLMHPNLFKNPPRQFHRRNSLDKGEALDKDVLLGNFLHLCRKSISKNQKVAIEDENAKLSCKYNWAKENPLNRYKIELLSREPDIIKVLDFAGDHEMGQLTGYSFGRLRRADPFPNPSFKSSDDFVLSQRAYLDLALEPEEYSARHLLGLNRRIEQVTGLRFNEQNHRNLLNVSLSVAGGYFWPQFDSIDNLRESIDRELTFMIFLNGVEVGGHITFPNIGLSVEPQKGAALFFQSSQQGLLSPLLYAECPVVLGQKWVAKKQMIVKTRPSKICPTNKKKPKI